MQNEVLVRRNLQVGVCRGVGSVGVSRDACALVLAINISLLFVKHAWGLSRVYS